MLQRYVHNGYYGVKIIHGLFYNKWNVASKKLTLLVLNTNFVK